VPAGKRFGLSVLEDVVAPSVDGSAFPGPTNLRVNVISNHRSFSQENGATTPFILHFIFTLPTASGAIMCRTCLAVPVINCLSILFLCIWYILSSL